jgi:hypothetical protein
MSHHHSPVAAGITLFSRKNKEWVCKTCHYRGWTYHIQDDHWIKVKKWTTIVHHVHHICFELLDHFNMVEQKFILFVLIYSMTMKLTFVAIKTNDACIHRGGSGTINLAMFSPCYYLSLWVMLVLCLCSDQWKSNSNNPVAAASASIGHTSHPNIPLMFTLCMPYASVSSFNQPTLTHIGFLLQLPLFPSD